MLVQMNSGAAVLPDLGNVTASVGHTGDKTFGVGFLFFALLMGLMARNFVPKKIPYTVVMLLVGFILGEYEQLFIHVPGLAPLAESTLLWQEMNPHLILYVFLPALIFESAFSTDFHIFNKSLSQVSLLAGPGVLLGLLLTAGLCSGLLASYGWDWPTLLMFGSILSATDPVAVVSIQMRLIFCWLNSLRLHF